MKKINKIFAFLFALGMAWGIYSFNQLRIFESLEIRVENDSSSFKPDFNQKEKQCFVQSSQVSPFAKKSIRLLSWNIHKGADQGWQQDLERFSQNQDFVLLQEATPDQNLPAFSTALFVSSFAYKGQQSGVKSFSQTVPQSYCGISQAEPWIRIPKVASAMTFPLEQGGELFVINAHLINFEWSPKAYRAQLEQIFALIPPHKSAVILAGDFNAWSSERKQILDEFATQSGLTEVTFLQDERTRFLGNPLDYVFVRGMNVISSKTEKVSSSDHAPVWVELGMDN